MGDTAEKQSTNVNYRKANERQCLTPSFFCIVVLREDLQRQISTDARLEKHGWW